MSDLAQLRGLVDQFPPPDFDELARVAGRRRRRSVAAAMAGATLGTLAVLVATGLGGTQRTSDPVGPPEPTPTWDAGEWPPERVKAEGHAHDYAAYPPDEPGPAARVWEVCVGKSCGRGQWTSRQERHTALEMSVDGFRTSTLFALTRSRYNPRSIQVQRYDEDTLFVVDVVRPHSLHQRFRLLDVDGTQVPLDLLAGTTPAAPGPDVVRVGDVDLYRLDREARTLQKLDTPFLSSGWAPVYDEFLWGIGAGCDIVWQDPDGAWQTHEVGCRGATPWLADPMPSGLMVVELHGGSGISTLVSRDRGATWARYGPDVELDFLTSDG